MKTKTVKEKVLKILLSRETRMQVVIDQIDKLYRKEFLKDTKSPVSIHSQKDVNKLPPMLLDDDIADWEHDNLVKNG